MSRSRLLTDEFDAHADRRSAHLYATDAQFRDTAPLDAVTEAIRRPGPPLAALVATVMEGYADRPDLGERATEPVTDPDTGRTTLRLLERFDMLTYGELRERVGAVASEWRHHPEHALESGEFVAVLGPAGAVYIVVDLACVRSGAVSVPLQAGASAEHLAPMVEQTGPRLLVAHIDHLEVAVEPAANAPSLGRIIVMDHRTEVTTHQEERDSARDRGVARARGVALDTPASVIDRGRTLPSLPQVPDGSSADALSALIYTSGSTGLPKGAMYTERPVRQFWVDFVPGRGVRPSIALNYLPLSHMTGRGMLFGTLAKRGPRLLRGVQRPVDALRGPIPGPAHRVPHGSLHLRHALPAPPRRVVPPDRDGWPSTPRLRRAPRRRHSSRTASASGCSTATGRRKAGSSPSTDGCSARR
ncbi:AMP-binding protein [Streptomyces sp. NPDC007076]|uniref:AMP-binding protein n=1 Tax=Streptomyces sp. NPDC007076 TaxID=3160975 RepID=UPI0033F70A30